MKAIIIAALLAASAAQAQIFQCVVDGRKVFSDQPCGKDSKAVDVRPAAGRARLAPATEGGAPQQATPSDLTKRADDAVKKRFLDEDIYRKEQRVKSLRAEMESKLAELREKKRYAYNNLAGATWEASISQEMNATVASYDSQIRSVESEISALRSQRAAMDKP